MRDRQSATQANLNRSTKGEPKAGVVVTARVGSYRLPNKVLRRIGRDTLIERLLKNIVQGNPYPVVVALPASQENNVIEKIIRDAKVPVEIYRGEDDSPAHRMLAVAEARGWDYLVRVTHDNPLMDLRVLKKQITWTLKNHLDYSYITKMPVGTHGEVIRTSVLRRLIAGAKHTEFLTYMLRQKPVKGGEYLPLGEFHYDARLTVDYPEDLQLLRIIDHNLAPGYGTLMVIDYLKQNPYLLNINRQPEVSVVIANRNYAAYVVSAIGSVVAQTEQNWECLIYDDCSTDNSLNKIVCYLSALDGVVSRRFKLCALPEHQGLGAICNRALRHIRGKYYIRLDSDDILRNDALQVMRKALDTNPGLAGAWAGYRTYGEGVEEKDFLPDAPGYEYHPACCLLRTETVLATGYREKQEFYEGADFLSRFRKQYAIAKIAEPLWVRRIHSAQMTRPETAAERDAQAKKLAAEGIRV